MSEEQKTKPRGGNPVTVGLIVVIVIIVAAALAYFAFKTIEPAPTPIGEILADLRSYDGQSVTVQGKVGNPINLIYKAFDLTDGDTVTVSGMVNEAFRFGSLSITVILEPAAE